MLCMTAVHQISKGNHVKFLHFVLLAISEFQQFRIFWELSQKLSVPIVPVSKISEFLESAPAVSP